MGLKHPLSQDIFFKIIGKFYEYDFLTMSLKFYWLALKKIKGSTCPRELSRDLFSTGGKRKFAIFKVFRAYLRVFDIFSYNFFVVASSYPVLAAKINSLLISALVCLETKLNVPILSILWRFVELFKLSVMAQAFGLGQWFFFENLVCVEFFG